MVNSRPAARGWLRREQLVRVLVMHVGGVIMRVDDVAVGVPVRVLAEHRWVVRVIVMAIVVAMRVLVVARAVHVLVSVLLRDVQVDAEPEARCGDRGQQ